MIQLHSQLPADKQALHQFTDSDVRYADSPYPRIFCTRSELLYDPLPWQREGLQQTASGYGARLTHTCKISLNGRLYRLYTTILSNNGSTWFIAKKRKIFVD